MAKSKRKKSGGTKKQPPKAKQQPSRSTGASADAPAGTEAKQPPKMRREERIAAERAARRRRVRLIQAGAIAAAVAVVVGLLVFLRAEDAATDDAIAELTSGSCTYDERSDPTAAPPGNHVAEPVYEVDPPAGGNHLSTASGPGVFTAQNAPAVGQVVHALEHGYVALWHAPDLPAEKLDEIKGVYDAYDRDVLVVPRATVQGEVAATAWGHRLLCKTVEPATLEQFVEMFRNQGPEKIPH